MNDKVTLVKRDIGYMFWVLAEQVANLALPRLVLFPIAAYLIGKESFGVFSTALSVTLILGLQPQNGLGTGLLRHLPEYTENERSQLLGTTMKMCHPVMLLIVLAGILGSVLAGITKLAEWELIGCLIPLLISLYSDNQFMLILTEMRFLRQFQQRAIWITGRAIWAVITGMIGALIGGAVGLAWGFTLGNFMVYLWLRSKRDSWYKTAYNKQMATVLKGVWLQITIAGILTVSTPHLNRIILSMYHSYIVVSDLVAATSVAFIFLAPIQCFGMLILSMISKYSSIKEFSRRGKMGCLIMALLGVIVIPIIMFMVGPTILKFLYPRFGQDPLALIPVVVWIIPAGALISIVSPFVLKFASVRTMPIINSISFICTIIPAFVLIPGYKASGAAWAIVMGNSISAVIFCMVFVRLLLRGTTAVQDFANKTQTALPAEIVK